MAKRQRKQTPQGPAKLTLADFRLVDFRTVAMKCERLIAPDEASKGTYRSTVNAKIGVPKKQGDKNRGDLYIVLSLNLQGNKVTIAKDEKKIGDKSFSIEVKAEAWCRATKKEVSEDTVPTSVLNGLIAQVYPLLMTRARAYAADMGYRGVRPGLGYDMDKAKELDATDEEIVTS